MLGTVLSTYISYFIFIRKLIRKTVLSPRYRWENSSITWPCIPSCSWVLATWKGVREMVYILCFTGEKGQMWPFGWMWTPSPWVLDFSIQLGVKVTSLITYAPTEGKIASVSFEAQCKMTFYNCSISNPLSILWSQPCLLVDCIYVLDFLPEETFWNYKTNVCVNILSFETNTIVRCSLLRLTVRRTLLLCTNDCNPGCVA